MITKSIKINVQGIFWDYGAPKELQITKKKLWYSIEQESISEEIQRRKFTLRKPSNTPAHSALQ